MGEKQKHQEEPKPNFLVAMLLTLLMLQAKDIQDLDDFFKQKVEELKMFVQAPEIPNTI